MYQNPGSSASNLQIMAMIPWDQARNLVVVDPYTGREIPHVKATDPVQGWLEIYTVVPCAPFEGMEMLHITKLADGTEVTEKFHYTFVQMHDGSGHRFYLTYYETCAYDLVNKYSGEVIHESTAKAQASLRAREPAVVTGGAQFSELGRHRGVPAAAVLHTALGAVPSVPPEEIDEADGLPEDTGSTAVRMPCT
jgi:hypothetical protein